VFFAKFLPSTESHHVTRHELIGIEGTAIYPISESVGTGRVFDKLHTLRQFDCRVWTGERAIAEGEKIIIMEYDAENKLFYVRPAGALFEEKEKE
jgi:hypothetical protein